MLKKLLKNTTFQSIIKDYYKQNKDNIVDILLFGSIMRGKEKPNDVDLLIISKNPLTNNITYNLRKSLKKLDLNFSITEKTYHELFQPSFLAREAFLTESYSLINKKFVSKGLGFINYYLFRYELKGFNKSKRMLFYYSLYGRNNSKGMINKLKAIKFSDGTLLVPIENVEEGREYFNNLEIKFNDFPILIPERVSAVLYQSSRKTN
ncbi:nucleotidyltransferase domain-containing protein [Candidatus Woesearchaeota archaeon]|jgi:predicted nucleotidyltransferase|nr:nucleotidyltransferase domain-containing protein [Candidatus Woesearchaeota archaeon]